MRAAGVDLLPIPENYYDDLEARFDLDAGARSTGCGPRHPLRRGRAGRYFQVYTRVFAERFFFEVVQRHDYDGFGAPNAPIRLAAQTRLSRGPGIPRL